MLEHTAYAVVLKERKFLVVRRDSTDAWSLPGGHVEDDEPAEQCILRELKRYPGIPLGPIEQYGETEAPSPVEQDVMVKLSFFVIKVGREFQVGGHETENLAWIDSKYDGSKGSLALYMGDWLIDKLIRDDLID